MIWEGKIQKFIFSCSEVCMYGRFKNTTLKNVDGAIMHFIYSHRYNTISAADSSDMNWVLFRA